MKKFLLFTLASSIAIVCVAQSGQSEFSFVNTDNKTDNFKSKIEQKPWVWEQLTTKRKSEDDVQATLPWFSEKELQVNLSQLINIITLPSGVIIPLIFINHLRYCKEDHQVDHIFMVSFISFSLKGVYSFFIGEQKWPFRIVDSQVPSTPENQTSKSE